MNAFRPCIVIPYYDHPLTSSDARWLEPLRIPCWSLMTDRILGARMHCLRQPHELLGQDHQAQLQSRQRRGGPDRLPGRHRRRPHHALQVDADNQHRLADAPAMLGLAAASPHALILGAPLYDATVPRVRLIGRYLTHGMVALNTLSLAIRDSMCGYRVYPLTELVELADGATLGARMEFDIEVTVRLSWGGTEIVICRRQ